MCSRPNRTGYGEQATPLVGFVHASGVAHADLGLVAVWAAKRKLRYGTRPRYGRLTGSRVAALR
jgi:hypothetical protein